MKNAAEFIFVTLCICVALLLSPLIVLWTLVDDFRLHREMERDDTEWAEHGEL